MMALGAAAYAVARSLRQRRAIDFAGRTVVIFGGSRGLGLVLARQFAAEGASLVLVARDSAELDRAAADLRERGARVATYACDITNAPQVTGTIDAIVAAHGTIDVLVNDAGIIEVGPLDHMTTDDFQRAMATHFWGPLTTILASLPHMRRAGARRIVNISSIGGKMAVPHLLPYSASKFALAGLSEGLQAELAAEGFVVTTVYPGLMRTGSTYNARFKGQHRREFAWFHMAASVPGFTIGAERAARQIVDACRHGDAELIITPAARWAVLARAVAPRTVARAMSLTNRMLPAATGHGGAESRPGWQSVSRHVPSSLTSLSDRASMLNNELPPGAATEM
jgi:NAD(P)-dependent dehydrogenase (short-subunit alcohol dehydrogenase family)